MQARARGWGDLETLVGPDRVLTSVSASITAAAESPASASGKKSDQLGFEQCLPTDPCHCGA